MKNMGIIFEAGLRPQLGLIIHSDKLNEDEKIEKLVELVDDCLD